MTKQELEQLAVCKITELAFDEAVGSDFCPGDFMTWIYRDGPANINVTRKAVGYKLWRRCCRLCGKRFKPRELRFFRSDDVPELILPYCLGCVAAGIWYMKYHFNWVNKGGHARAEEFENKLLKEINKLSANNTP